MGMSTYASVERAVRDRSSMGKVVVRARDGSIHNGFASDEYIATDLIKVLSNKGDEQEFSMDDVKAIFFVKEFEGNSKHEELKFLNNHTRKKWVWVRVTFFDGEALEGRVENTKTLLSSPGFYLWPSDEDTNNDLVYIVTDALQDFEILAT